MTFDQHNIPVTATKEDFESYTKTLKWNSKNPVIQTLPKPKKNRRK